MNQILQARVNLLIERNKAIFEQQQRKKSLKLKVKPQNSYSIYQEPSTFIANPISEQDSEKQIQLIEVQQGKDIFKNRFAYFQRQKYQKMSFSELENEQYYLKKAIETIHQKINRTMKKVIKQNLNIIQIKQKHQKNIISRSFCQKSKENIKERLLRKTHLPTKKLSTKKQQRQKCPKIEINDEMGLYHQNQMNKVTLKSLHQEFSHLQKEMKQHMGKIEQNISQINLDLAQKQLSSNVHQLEKIVTERKKQINKIKRQIKKSAQLLVNLSVNQTDISDNVVKINHNDLNYQQLQILMKEKVEKIKQKSKYFDDIISQNQNTLNFIGQLEIKIEALKDVQQTSNILAKKPDGGILTPMSQKVKNTLASATISQHQYYSQLLKRKEIMNKSIHSQNIKWKMVYNKKMKKLVNQYSNIKNINDITLKLQTQKMYNMGEMSEIMNLQWASVDNSRVNGEI